MINKLYSYILVFMQFALIMALLYINQSIFNNLLSLFISSIGFFFGVYAIYCNSLSNFNIIPEIKDEALLIKTGAYKYIRHPMYFAVFLIMLGVVITNISYINFVLYMFLILTLFLKAKKEEKLWINRIKEYEKYKSKTKMFIPFIL